MDPFPADFCLSRLPCCWGRTGWRRGWIGSCWLTWVRFLWAWVRCWVWVFVSWRFEVAVLAVCTDCWWSDRTISIPGTVLHSSSCCWCLFNIPVWSFRSVCTSGAVDWLLPVVIWVLLWVNNYLFPILPVVVGVSLWCFAFVLVVSWGGCFVFRVGGCSCVAFWSLGNTFTRSACGWPSFATIIISISGFLCGRLPAVARWFCSRRRWRWIGCVLMSRWRGPGWCLSACRSTVWGSLSLPTLCWGRLLVCPVGSLLPLSCPAVLSFVF